MEDNSLILAVASPVPSLNVFLFCTSLVPRREPCK
jgi:hypothetical protein